MTEARPLAADKTEDSNEKEAEDILVTGSLWKAIWTMSWPLLLTTTSSSLVGLVDVQISRKLGSAAQAAVGVSEQILFMFMVFLMALGVGTTALVSRAAGARDSEEVDRATGQSLSLSIATGVVLTLACLAVSGFVITRSGNAPDVAEAAQKYLNIYAFMLIPVSLNVIINSAFRAIGRAKAPLVVILTSTMVTIVGDYLTVIKNWPVPGLGLRGIAASGVVGSCVAVTVALYLVLKSPLRSSLKWMFPFSKSYSLRILRVGIPSALNRLSWSLSVFVLFAILRHCDNATCALASWTIGMRVEALIFMPLLALSLAVSSIVGQNLGAKKTDRAVKAGWQVTFIGIGMMLVLGSGLYFGADFLAHTMSQDPVTIDFTRSYLRVNALAEPFLALAMVLSGALQGAGDTRTPMWITIFTNWIVRLPVAWALAITLHLGPVGAWMAMATSICMNGTLTTIWYRSKRWIKTTV
ncbi:MAG TPA: MATE family efflux transporter [Oculatellaceae cyanobacterium]